MNVMTVDGFHATIEFDPDLDMFRGEILGLNAERVNDIATPCVMNLLCRVVLFQSASFAQAVG